MKPKQVLKILFVIIYTSSWWACSIWGGIIHKLWMIPALLSCVLIVYVFLWFIDNWNNDKKQ